MFYTYVLESVLFPRRRYIGHTANLKQRLSEHNAGKCHSTARYAPWKIKAYFAFETELQASRFELVIPGGN